MIGTAARLGEGRVFASHYQIVLRDGPDAFFDEPTENWTEESHKRGFAGNPRFRMFSTEADLNDHWVELVLRETPVDPRDWHKTLTFDFHCETGTVQVAGILDTDAVITARMAAGPYTVQACSMNPGVDQFSLNEMGPSETLSDETLKRRRDLEWHRIHLVPAR
ncbi:MAG: competence protein ComJ [Litorimonas sp.]